MYTENTACRACGYAQSTAQGIKYSSSETLIEVLNLGVQPLANDFHRQGAIQAGYAPLKVLFCPRCSLAQLSVVVDPAILYRNYPYVTSPSQTMREHFDMLIKDIEAEAGCHKRILEIGSNDGKLLAELQKRQHLVTGIDPAANLAAIATAAGIPTVTAQFPSAQIPVTWDFDIIIARHVFCHVDNWKEFVLGLGRISNKDTLVCIETPYAVDTLSKCEFDTVYHEHLSYLTIKSVAALLKNTHWQLHKMIRYSIHGGAILLMLRRKDSGHPSAPEVLSDSVTLDDWMAFGMKAKSQIGKLRSTVLDLVGQGKRIAGLGASAKSTVWINSCGFTRREIGFISDNTPQKQLMFSPGNDIPIADEGAIMRELPDYTICFAWNYMDEILRKFDTYLLNGGKFIVPVPDIKIIGNDYKRRNPGDGQP